MLTIFNNTLYKKYYICIIDYHTLLYDMINNNILCPVVYSEYTVNSVIRVCGYDVGVYDNDIQIYGIFVVYI